MELKRIEKRSDAFFDDAMRLYVSAFPSVERRELADHLLALGRSDFKCCSLVDGGSFVGIAFFWESDDFIYLEHLAVAKHLRGHGYGKRALALLKSVGKPVILEIEPPETDEVTAARRRFYEGEGFVYNDINHVQLHYRPDDEDCILKLMSFPDGLSANVYERFNSYLHSAVTSYD